MAKRWTMLAFLALMLPSCKYDPTLTTAPPPPATVISSSSNTQSSGGVASANSPANITGGAGGAMSVFTQGPISIGTGNPAPVPPVTPTPPTTGTSLSSIAADVSLAGTILIPGSVTTDAAAAVRNISSTNGDIVVSGLLQAGRPTGASPVTMVNLSLSAPNGTVYVTGTISTADVDGLSDGDNAGTISISANRIVLTGTLNANGDANSAGTGGVGGAVTLTIGGAGDHIFFTGGSISTLGGSGTTAGGAGGNVSLSATAKLHAYGSITSSGGSSNGSSNSVT